MTEKAVDYVRLGADCVWVIDPQKRTLRAFAPDSPPREYTAADTVSDQAALPGFSCKIAEFFEQA